MTGSRPNMLIVMPDQMRGDCLSLEGHPVLRTPNMDRIGKQGVYFTRAYTTCASCIGARRSLLTGQFPATNGMVGYRENVPIKTVTLTQLLRDAGYATALAGRYMHQSPYSESYGFEKEVRGSVYLNHDDYARFLNAHAPSLGGIRGTGLTCNGRSAKPWPLREDSHPTNWSFTQARRLLAEHKSRRPLFLVASFYAPHPPLFPPQRHMQHFLRKQLPPAAVGQWETPPAAERYATNVDANRVVLDGAALRQAQAGYFGLIRQIDELLPGLLGAFKRKSAAMRRPWIVVFTSDHGEMLGDHYLFRKCEPYEGSSRIPFLIQGSRKLGFASGRKCNQPVCLEDIMPTLLDLAGVPIPGHVEGKSLLPILRGKRVALRARLHGEHSPCYDQAQAYHFLTDGRMKYIWRPHDGSEQLFDLQSDPQELRDLARRRDRSAARSQWRRAMVAHLKNRPEGFSDGKRLFAGRAYDAVMPHARPSLQ